MAEETMPFALDKGGVRLAVRLVPRANRTGVDGIVQGIDGRPVLQLRLSAPPVDGAANKALLAFLADALHLRKASFSIRSGETARFKILFIEGDGPAIIAKLKHWVACGGG